MTKQQRNTRQQPLDLSVMVFGKVPPQVTDLEAIVLGVIMMEQGAFQKVSDMLRPECFYVPSNQLVYKAMQQLNKLGQNIDLITVINQLRDNGELELAGGYYYVTKLTNDVSNGANLQTWAAKVVNAYMLREIIAMSGQAANDAYNDGADPHEMLASLRQRVGQIENSVPSLPASTVADVMYKTVQEIEFYRSQGRRVIGVQTGHYQLDRATYGWMAGELVIVAARPAVGKTAFALNMLRAATTQGNDNGIVLPPVPTAIFSLEMANTSLAKRMLAAESGVSLEKLNTGQINDREAKLVGETAANLSQRGLYFSDTSSLNPDNLRAKIYKLVTQMGVRLIVIDYLQLMEGTGDSKGNRNLEIASISRMLKTEAKDWTDKGHPLTIVALSQLNRDNQKAGQSPRPELHQLRDSGAIEQDADTVIFLYQPAETNMEQYREVLARTPNCPLDITPVFFYIAKGRNIRPGTEFLSAFHGPTQQHLFMVEKPRDTGGQVYDSSPPPSGNWTALQ